MVNSTSMSSDRSIPDLWDVFGGRGLGVRRNSWQKMQMQLSEDEQAVTELFNDLHLHADLPADNSPGKHKNSRYPSLFSLENHISQSVSESTCCFSYCRGMSK